MEGLILITFIEDAVNGRVLRGHAELAGSEESIAHQLEHELKTTRDELHSTIEQLETSNEELESSKEELQSLNEELSTVNSQLQDKVLELEVTNNDLANLFSSTDIATIFLDTEFRIRRFTPAACNLFTLISTDTGRPISDISHRFNSNDLLADTETVLRKLAPLEKEISTNDGRWHIRRILPYRTQDNRIDGVIITFPDITDFRHPDLASCRYGNPRAAKPA
jgi:two-component system, chemotaxis family, CheB/CheR fusion protein